MYLRALSIAALASLAAAPALADGVEGAPRVQHAPHQPVGQYALDGAAHGAAPVMRQADMRQAERVALAPCAASALRPYQKMLCEHQTTLPMRRPIRMADAHAADTPLQDVHAPAHQPRFRTPDLRKPGADNSF